MDKDLKLSQLVDGELKGFELDRCLNQLAQDEEMQALWERYHAIGHAMRSSDAKFARPDFAAKVSAMIQAEVIPFKKRQPVRHRLVTYALAASLAGIAVFVGKSIHQNADRFYAPEPVALNDSNESKVQVSADAQFNDYWVMHNEVAYSAGSAGMMPYVRMVSSGPER